MALLQSSADRKLRSGYALPAFPAPAAPSPVPTSSHHLIPTAAMAVFCSALWSVFSPPVTRVATSWTGAVKDGLVASFDATGRRRSTGHEPNGAVPAPNRKYQKCGVKRPWEPGPGAGFTGLALEFPSHPMATRGSPSPIDPTVFGASPHRARAHDRELAIIAAMPQCIAMQVFSTRTYERAVHRLLGEEARREMEASIVAAPHAAPVIRGTGGIRKLRWGPALDVESAEAFARSISSMPAPDAIYLLTAYAKADREDLTRADTRALSRLVTAIKKEASGR